MNFHVLFILLPVSFGFLIPNTSNNTEEGVDFTLGKSVELMLQNDKILDNLKESVMKLIYKIDNLINKINEDSFSYLEALEEDKIYQMIKLFDSPPCVGGQELESLKKYFKVELGLYELPLREAMEELKDKMGELDLSVNIEENILEMKQIICQLTVNSSCGVRTTTFPLCLDDSCFTPQTILVTNNMLGSEKPIMSTNFSLYRLPTECSRGRFRCSSGHCIPSAYVCDGEQDCHDGSDERIDCPRACLGRRCRNLDCITPDNICNGVDDCGDGTDEEECTINRDDCNLGLEKFLCTNGNKCLQLSEVCDGKRDCSDGSDEAGNCNVTLGCMNCSSVGGACIRTPSGPLCLRKCPSNFILDLRTGVCINSEFASDLLVMYKTHSFMGTIENLKVLSKRFSNGFILLKKQMSYNLEKTLDNLNKCTQSSLNDPFSVE